MLSQFPSVRASPLERKRKQITKKYINQKRPKLTHAAKTKNYPLVKPQVGGEI